MKKTKSAGNETPKKMFLRVFLTLVLVLTLVATAGVCIYMLWETPPEIQGEAPAMVVNSTPVSTVDPYAVAEAEALKQKLEEEAKQEALDNEGSPDTGRKDGVYTLLLVGNDNGFGNTDTIMVCRFDTENHMLDCVSIPRDTYANINWNVRKINCIYSGTINSGGVGIDGLSAQIKNLIGFDIDCYAIVNLNIFIEAIDLLGGVDFDVPCNMYYEDPKQDLSISISAGYQHLNGYQAMGVCRYRSGYSNGDLGRIETQHLFLKACAEQFITLGNIPNVSKIIDLIADNVDTNLTAANIAYFIRQGLKCSIDDVNFYTMPNTPMSVQGASYTFVKLNDWLNMINAYLNPYNTPITESNLDCVYLDENWHFGCTATIKGPGYLNG